SGNARRVFLATTVISLPPSSPGSATARTATFAPHKVSGAPFPHRPPSFDREVNTLGWTVPSGTSAAEPVTSPSTAVQKAPLGDPGNVTFLVNNGLGFADNYVAEPSGASGGGVVFMSANSFAAYSSDGGARFTRLDPTAIFPADEIGFCC